MKLQSFSIILASVLFLFFQPDELEKQYDCLSKNWHKLSEEEIRTNDKLGLDAEDPKDIIAALVHHLPPKTKEADDKIPFQGETIRLRLLVNLVRLALSLDIGIHESTEHAIKQKGNNILELKIRQWMRYYIEAIEVEQGIICVYWKVPTDQYEEYIGSVNHDFFIRRWIDYNAALLDYGWVIGFRSGNITIDENKKEMPPDLFAKPKPLPMVVVQ